MAILSEAQMKRRMERDKKQYDLIKKKTEIQKKKTVLGKDWYVPCWRDEALSVRCKASLVPWSRTPIIHFPGFSDKMASWRMCWAEADVIRFFSYVAEVGVWRINPITTCAVRI